MTDNIFRKAIILIILIIPVLTLSSCLEFFKPDEAPDVTIKIEEFSYNEGDIHETDTGYWYEFWWKTAADAESILYRYQLGENETIEDYEGADWEDIPWDEDVGKGSIGWPEDPKYHDDARYRYLRDKNTAFFAEQRYIIGIESKIETTNYPEPFLGRFIYNKEILVNPAVPKNGIWFQFNYQQDDHYADRGDFIAGVWKDIADYGQQPARTEVIGFDEYNPDTPYFLPAYAYPVYQFRVFRDYNEDGYYTPLTDPSHTSPYQVSVVNGENYDLIDQEGILELSDPFEYPSGGIIVSTNTTSIKPGEPLDIEVEIENQWNNFYTGSINVNFESTDPEEAIITTGKVGNYVFDEADPVWVHPVILELVDTSDTNITRIRGEITYTNISGQPVTISDITDTQVEIDDSHIELLISYTENGRYDGDYVIYVEEIFGGVTEDTETTIITAGEFILDPTFEHVIPTKVGRDYDIEIFRDDNGDQNYDPDTDAYVSHLETNMDSEQIQVPLTLVEPATLIEDTIEITDQNPTEITSGDIVTIDIELRDQWGHPYEEDTFYTIPTEQTIDLSLSSPDLEIGDIDSVSGGVKVDTDTIRDSDKDGIISADLIIKRIPDNVVSAINTAINPTWNGASPSTIISSDQITVRNNYIEGTFTYDNDGLQTSGNLKVEVWDTSTFTDSSSPNIVYTTDSTTYPATQYGFTAGTFPIASGAYSYTFKVPVENSNATYYIRVFRDFDDNGYDTTNDDDIRRDAYQAYPAIPISINHNNAVLNFTDNLINKSELLRGINAELDPANDMDMIREADYVKVDIMFANQWSNPYTGSVTRDVTVEATNTDIVVDDIVGYPSNVVTVSGSSESIDMSLDKIPGPGTPEEVTWIKVTDNIDNTITGQTGNTITLHDSSIIFDVDYSGEQPYGGEFRIELDNGMVIEISEPYDGSTFSYTSQTYYLPAGAYDLKSYIDFEEADAYFDGSVVTLNNDVIDNDIEASYTDNILNVNNAQHNNPIFTLSDGHPRDIQYMTLTGAPGAGSKVKSGDASQSITFDINTFDQWKQAYGDNTESIYFTWNGNTSPGDDNVIINGDATPPFLQSINGSGTTLADLIMENTTPTNDTNRGTIYMEYSANANVNESISNITVDGEKPTLTPNPADGSTQYNNAFDIILTFSEPMNTGMLNLSGGDMDSEVGSTSWSAGNTVLTVSPSGTWAEGTNRELFIDCEDEVGNAMNTYTLNYYIDYTVPTVDNTIPTDGSNMNSNTFEIVLEFSEDMNTSSGSLSVTGMGAEALPINPPSWDDLTHLRISPSTTWSEGINRELRIQSLEDASGNAFPGDVVRNYTIDVTAPVQQSAEVLTGGDQIVITFDENLDANPPFDGNFDVTTTQGEPVNVTSTSVSGTDLTLDLDRIIEDTETGVNITYDKDNGTPQIKDDIFGNITGNFAIPAANFSLRTPQADISPPASGQTEGNNLVYDVNLDFASSYDVTVSYAISGTNIQASDYDDTIDGGDIIISAGTDQGTITIGTIDDNLYEGNEDLRVTLTDVIINGTSTGNIGTAIADGTIQDAQSLPTVNITGVSTNIIPEDDAVGQVDVTVGISTPHYSNVDIVFDTSGSATGGGTDYTLNNLTIPAEQPSAIATITINNDTIYEQDETINISIDTATSTSGTGHPNIGASSETVTIDEDDAVSVVEFSSATASYNENVGNADITLTVSPPASQMITATVDITGGSATEGAGGNWDYTFSAPMDIDIPSNTTNHTFQIPINNDNVYEGLEDFQLQITSVSGVYSVGPQATHTVDITDNESVPTVSYEANKSVNENVGGGSVDVALNMSNLFDTNTTVTIGISGGSATGGGTDYDVVSTSILIPAYTASANATLNINDDDFYEDDETVILDLISATNGVGVDPADHTLTISENENIPEVRFTLTTGSVNEDVGTGIKTVNISMSEKYKQNLTVDFTVSGGNATGGGVDFTMPASGSVSIPFGSTTTSFDIMINDDGIYEPDETLILNIDDPAGNPTADTGTYILTILDNEPIPEVSFTNLTGSVAEDVVGGVQTVSLDIDVPYYQDTDISFTVIGGGTTADASDYSIPASVTLPAENLSTTFDITINDDASYEPDETLTLSINNPTGDPTANNNDYVLTILNDETAPEAAFTTTTDSVAEGSGVTTVTVELDALYGYDTTIFYSVGGDATGGGVDYDLSPASFVIPANNWNASFTIDVLDDSVYEEDETMSITLTGTDNDTTIDGANDTFTLTITEDEASPVANFTSTTDSVAEGSGVTTVTVQLNREYDQITEVFYTIGGDATGGGDDYTLSPATFTIPANTLTADFTIDVLDDSVYEEDETMSITLTGTDNDTTIDGANDTFTLTITEDEASPVANFTSTTDSVAEGSGVTTVTVQLNREYDQITEVFYTIGGDATGGGDDYTLSPATFTIPANTLTADFTIDVLDDIDYELDEAMSITLTGTDNDTSIGVNDTFTLTITADGDPVPTVDIATPVSITEPTGSSTTLSVDVTLDRESYEDIIVDYTFTDVTATGGNGTDTVNHDYNNTTGNITIPAGSTGPVTIDIEIFDNTGADPPSEDFEITISLNVASGSAILGTSVSTATINQ